MVHRYSAGTLAVVITLLLVWAVRFRRDRNQPLTPVTALFVVVCLQAALGALTVTMLLKPLIVTAHLLGGLTTLGLLWWLSLAPATPQLTEQETTLRKYAVLGLVVLVMQFTISGCTQRDTVGVYVTHISPCQPTLQPPLAVTLNLLIPPAFRPD